MDQNQIDLFKTVCFLVLMQHGEGLTSKAPTYIQEKMKASEDPIAAWQMLDGDGQLKVVEWAGSWNFPLGAVMEEIQKNEVTS
ncbi:hypothetical protein ES708_24746 [subsurface metagenome]